MCYISTQYYKTGELVMYIMTTTKKKAGKTYTYSFLVHSYRDKGTSKRHFLANLSKWKPEDVELLKLPKKVIE